MWHWNSLWAHAPGDPPPVDDPIWWQTPWTPEQALALQVRNWETLLSTGHAWWAMTLSAWSMVPGWPGQPDEAAQRKASAPEPRAASRGRSR